MTDIDEVTNALFECKINKPSSYNNWNIWSDKCKHIPFKSNKPSIGDGEDRLAYEFDTKPLGQNFPYDININGEKWELKKLDNGSFNSGKNGRISVALLKQNIIDSLNDAKSFLNEININELSNMIDSITDYGELCEKKCKEDGTLHSIYKLLNYHKTQLEQNINMVEVFDIDTGNKVLITESEYYKRAMCCKVNIETIKIRLGNNYKNAKLLSYLTHEYIVNPNKILDDFKELKFIFKDYILVFVDEILGYYPMTNPELKISFQRITRGNPRFYVNI